MNNEQTHLNHDNEPLGRLERSDLRSLLKDETTDMAGWIVDNLDLIEDELVIYFDRDTISCEHSVESMSADVFVQTLDGRKVVFENQFGHLDHPHFGKALAYRTLLQADIVIWVVEHERSEYAKIVRLFNCDVAYDLYVLVLQAGTSDCCRRPAGHIKAIAGPPEFMELVGRDERHRKYRGDQSLLALSALVAREAARRVGLEFVPRAATPNYLAASTGYPGVEYEISITRHATTVAIWINSTPRGDVAYRYLKRRRTKIEQALGAKLRWEKNRSTRGHKITLAATTTGWEHRQLWPNTAARVARAIAKLHTALQSHLQEAHNTSKTKPSSRMTQDPNPDSPTLRTGQST